MNRLTLTPIEQIAVKGTAVPSDIDMPVFLIANSGKGKIHERLGRVTSLTRLPVKNVKCLIRYGPKRESRTFHSTIAMIVAPSPNQGSQHLRFDLSAIVRVVDDRFDFTSESPEIVLSRNTSKLSIALDVDMPSQEVKSVGRSDSASFRSLNVETSEREERLDLVKDVSGILLGLEHEDHIIGIADAGIGRLDPFAISANGFDPIQIGSKDSALIHPLSGEVRFCPAPSELGGQLVAAPSSPVTLCPSFLFLTIPSSRVMVFVTFRAKQFYILLLTRCNHI